MSGLSDADLARLRRLEAATKRLSDHLRTTHGIERLASASRLEQLHAQAHRAEGTAWHRAWYVDPADAPDPDADDRAADAQEAEW